jgi:hypothetical protein
MQRTSRPQNAIVSRQKRRKLRNGPKRLPREDQVVETRSFLVWNLCYNDTGGEKQSGMEEAVLSHAQSQEILLEYGLVFTSLSCTNLLLTQA